MPTPPPPEETKWKEGQSGNPSGRPKGTKNRNTYLKMIMEARMKGVKDPFGVFDQEEITVEQALDLKIIQQALSGSHKHQEMIKQEVYGKIPDKTEHSFGQDAFVKAMADDLDT